MNYDRMTQLALRGVIRDALRRVVREGHLPGAHHFYITFLTRYPGVDIDESLAKKYPDEITIVIEHQYWDLKAHDESFEVTLKFGGVPKYISVPYTAITRFHDPSVGFAMQFDPPEEMSEQNGPLPTLARLKAESRPKVVGTDQKVQDESQAGKAEDKALEKDQDKDDADKVVSLDAFRKK